MTRRSRALILGLALAAFPRGVPAQTPEPTLAPLAPVPVDQWRSVLASFEKGVADGAVTLSTLQDQRAQLRSEIDKIESKTTELRQKEGSTNLLAQIRLKGLLNSLREKLEKDSDLQRQWQKSLGDFVQKSSSLLSLYNDDIEKLLDTSIAENNGDNLPVLVDLVRKRRALQTLIDRFPTAPEGQALPSLDLLEPAGEQNAENLRLTLDILVQRQKELEEAIERSQVRKAELGQELKLQDKMKDFLSGLQKSNEDSSYPQKSLGRGDLQSVEDPNQAGDISKELDAEARLQAKDRADLQEVGNYILTIEGRIQALKGGQ